MTVLKELKNIRKKFDFIDTYGFAHGITADDVIKLFEEEVKK